MEAEKRKRALRTRGRDSTDWSLKRELGFSNGGKLGHLTDKQRQGDGSMMTLPGMSPEAK